MKKDVTAIAKSEFSLIDENMLKSRIYTIRGLKVMLDADLAEIYGYSTKAFNQQVKNNIEKFDEDFRFQLCRNEYREILGSKFLTLEQGKYSKTSPYAFTEQGIYMLMTVLKGERATAQSKALIRLFKQMKDYIVAENRSLLGTDGIAQIASHTVQNTKDIAEIRDGLAQTREDVSVMKSDLQKVMENFIDPSTFDSIMENVHDTIKGHAPFVDEDIRLAMECDTDTDDESIILEADFSTEEPAKNGLISDMTLASVVSILNSIKNMES